MMQPPNSVSPENHGQEGGQQKQRVRHEFQPAAQLVQPERVSSSKRYPSQEKLDGVVLVL